MTQNAKPGYPAYLPSSYQVIGPEQDPHLTQLLVTAPKAATTQHPTARFWVRTPNVRCRTRVSLSLELFDSSVDPNDADNSQILKSPQDPGVGTLWVAEMEMTRGGAPKWAVVRNVVGTGDAPLSIPTDAHLWGYTFEVETNGQQLYGVFVPPDIGAAPIGPSKWFVSVRYESVQRLSSEEWNQMLQRYKVSVQPEGGVTLS